jgi:hypothetical protein
VKRVKKIKVDGIDYTTDLNVAASVSSVMESHVIAKGDSAGVFYIFLSN